MTWIHKAQSFLFRVSFCFIWFFGASPSSALDLVISNDSGSTELYWWSERINKNGNRPAAGFRSGTLSSGQSMKAGYGTDPFGQGNSGPGGFIGGEIVVYAFETSTLQPELTTQFLHSFNYIAFLTWQVATASSQVCVIHLNNPNQTQEWLQSANLDASGGAGGSTDMSGVEDRLDTLGELANHTNQVTSSEASIIDAQDEADIEGHILDKQNEMDAEADPAVGWFADQWDKIDNLIPAGAGNAPNAIFKIDMGVAELDWDPREHDMISSMGTLVKGLISIFAYIGTIIWMFDYYDKKAADVFKTSAQGASGQAFFGINLNIPAGIINSSIVVTIVAGLATLVFAYAAAFATEVCVLDIISNFMSAKGEIEGGSSWVLALLVVVDMFLPVNCVIGLATTAFGFVVVVHLYAMLAMAGTKAAYV